MAKRYRAVCKCLSCKQSISSYPSWEMRFERVRSIMIGSSVCALVGGLAFRHTSLISGEGEG